MLLQMWMMRIWRAPSCWRECRAKPAGTPRPRAPAAGPRAELPAFLRKPAPSQVHEAWHSPLPAVLLQQIGGPHMFLARAATPIYSPAASLSVLFPFDMYIMPATMAEQSGGLGFASLHCMNPVILSGNSSLQQACIVQQGV